MAKIRQMFIILVLKELTDEIEILFTKQKKNRFFCLNTYSAHLNVSKRFHS